MEKPLYKALRGNIKSRLLNKILSISNSKSDLNHYFKNKKLKNCIGDETCSMLQNADQFLTCNFQKCLGKIEIVFINVWTYLTASEKTGNF